MKAGIGRTSSWLWHSCMLALAAQPLVGRGASAEPEAVPLAYEKPSHLSASIFAQGEGANRLLFKFTREATRSGSTLKVQRDFMYPDGRPAAREHVVYEGNNLVSYALEEMQSGGSGSATIRRAADDPHKGTVEFRYRRAPGSSLKVHTEPLAKNTLTADMVGPFLVAHWSALMRGEKVKCRYLVVPRAETVGFTFTRESAVAEHGVITIKMEPTSTVLAWLVQPLWFTVENTPPHHVLKYAGRTTPKVQVQGKWEDLDAMTVFDWGSAR